ncbi:hypothetical protein ONZ51_g239 [Trametes cubensis]|uniref:Uncharacterized protein n=1 Tax=Trametes cubensis TaxID=1111947 RepID=A0AAD7U3S9_9APHY|nr:hypothetical protein ONZ51_g239 [Trametes cubensis]
MYNSQGLSPCQVAEEVLLVQSYGTGESVNQYACNAVMYSLWAACLLCNRQSPDNFSAYSESWGCAGQFSTPSSSRVDIPGWANLPLIDDNTFNEQAAKQEAGGTQTSGSSSTHDHTDPPSTSTSSSQSNDPPHSSPTNVGSTPAQPPSHPDSAAQSSGSSSPTGAAGQQSDSLPSEEVQTGGMQPSAVFDKPSEPRPATLTAPGQPPALSTTASYMTGSSQFSQSQAGSSNTDGHVQSSGSPTPTSNPAQSASRSSNRMDAIIGGVVGSVILLTIAVRLAYLIAARRRRRSTKHVVSIDTGPLGRRGHSEDDAFDDEHEQKEDMAEEPKTELYSPVHRPEDGSFASASYSMKLYDPDDPSTYPPRLSEICGRLPTRPPVNVSGAPEIYEVY